MRSLTFIHYTISSAAIASVVTRSFNSFVTNVRCEKATLSSCLLHLITLTSKLVERGVETCEYKEKIFSAVIKIIGELAVETRVTINALQLLKKLISSQIVHNMSDDPLVGNPVVSMDHFKMTLKETPNILMEKLKNNLSWEICDTTLEVFQLIVEFADVFPLPFGTIGDGEVYSQVYELAANDGVAYVRASAFNFFSKAVRAKLFLDKLSDLSDMAVKTLLEDEMPEPRVAACDLLAAMYAAGIVLDKGMQEKHCEAVYIASMKELDWEVKKATLRFWQCTIIKLLGDVKVPADPVLLHFLTTDNDTVSKIINVMDALSDSGCFKVIWSDVNDESDISVSLEACHVINNIQDLDKKWNFIDVIINSFDLEVEKGNLNTRKLKSKDFFTYICKKDWRDKLEARKNWVENTCDDLPSLLDHILNPDNSMGNWDHNSVDCY